MNENKQSNLEELITDTSTGIVINAQRDRSVICGTHKRGFIVRKCLDVLRNTPEIQSIVSQIPNKAMGNSDNEWWETEKAFYVYEETVEVMEKYAPEGYYFGSHIGDGSDFGYWKNEEHEDYPDYLAAIIDNNRDCEQSFIDGFVDKCQKEKKDFATEEDILTAFDEWKENEELSFEKLQDINYYSRL